MTKAMNLDHIVLVHKSQQREAVTWCRQHLGPRWDLLDCREGCWTCFWAGNEDWDQYRFYFASESDCAWFALKWT
jgi:hypothetical protein